MRKKKSLKEIDKDRFDKIKIYFKILDFEFLRGRIKRKTKVVLYNLQNESLYRQKFIIFKLESSLALSESYHNSTFVVRFACVTYLIFTTLMSPKKVVQGGLTHESTGSRPRNP